MVTPRRTASRASTPSKNSSAALGVRTLTSGLNSGKVRTSTVLCEADLRRESVGLLRHTLICTIFHHGAIVRLFPILHRASFDPRADVFLTGGKAVATATTTNTTKATTTTATKAAAKSNSTSSTSSSNRRNNDNNTNNDDNDGKMKPHAGSCGTPASLPFSHRLRSGL